MLCLATGGRRLDEEMQERVTKLPARGRMRGNTIELQLNVSAPVDAVVVC